MKRTIKGILSISPIQSYFHKAPKFIMLPSLLILLLFSSSLLLTSCRNDKSDDSSIELTISAAASLNEVLTEIKGVYEADNPNIDLMLNFAGSGSLAQQIEQGADVDLFLSASPRYTSNLIEKNLADAASLTPLLKNEIVLVTNVNSTLDKIDFGDLGEATYDKIGIGEPGSVPAGQYAEEILNHYNISDKVYERAVFAKDVKEVLSWVETNNIDLGIVYSTDAINSNEIRILASAPENSHTLILYPAVILKDSKHYDQTMAFLKFLTQEKATSIFEKYGFTPAY